MVLVAKSGQRVSSKATQNLDFTVFFRQWLTLLYQNEKIRPIQSLACDPCGEFLVATDWDGLIYFFTIKIVNETTENDVVTTSVELVELTEPGWPYKGTKTSAEKVANKFSSDKS